MRAAAAISQRPKWQDALADVQEQIPILAEDGQEIDLAFLFANSSYAHDFPQILARVREFTRGRLVVGCSGYGVIGPGKEIEGEPAISLLTFSLPNADLHAVRLTQSHLEVNHTPEDWLKVTGLSPQKVNAWFIFADPYSLEVERLISALSEAYPGVPIVGGLASGEGRRRWTYVFLNDEVYDYGAVAVALGGPYQIHTIVSQGCAPIGQTWTVTGVRGNVIDSIGGRPAFQLLIETVRSLPLDLQRRARGNLLIGLAMDEYKDDFSRGDFLIRNLLAADGERGVLAVGALPRVGQTLQFQLRDATTADEDLRSMLKRAKTDLAGQQPIAALLCSCNGRGRGLFGVPDHDAREVTEHLGPIPVAGFFCNGEIGPVGSQNFLHGYTASIALLL